ncbi:MAG TPA: CHASE3 domain-containing protein [Terriglobia bacterium]|nr:CHASE3 domain-containing protein [Terriglobia bacterium]
MSASARHFKRLPLGVRFLAGFGAALGILLAAGAVQYRTIQTLVETERWVAHTDVVLAELEGTLSAVESMESDSRGYVATGDLSFVRERQDWALTAKEHLRRLRVLTADNPRQRANLDRLNLLVEGKVTLMPQVVALRSERGPVPAAELIAQAHGTLMKEIHTLVAAMEAEENRLLAARRATSRASASRAARVTAFGSLLALVLAVVAGWIIHTDIVARTQAGKELKEQIEERERAQEEIKRLNRSLEQRVAERTAELAASNKELEAFTYSVAHDLRAPLRHMDAFLALLIKRSGGILEETSCRYLDKVTAAARTMAVLIDDLLQFSRLGRNEMAKRVVNLEALVQEIRLEFEGETPGRKIAWKIGRLPEVIVDPAMLRVVMVNLLSNALKFTRPCAEARIEVGSITGEANEDVIFVKDNGVGFDPRYSNKLFNVFQRLHYAENFEGTGVGLANVRRIIERHGGLVWAESTEGAGAMFSFSLPRFEA